MKEFPQKEWSRISLDPRIRLMSMIRLIVILAAVIPNPPKRLTISPFVQDLICRQNDEVMHLHLWVTLFRPLS